MFSALNSKDVVKKKEEQEKEKNEIKEIYFESLNTKKYSKLKNIKCKFSKNIEVLDLATEYSLLYFINSSSLEKLKFKEIKEDIFKYPKALYFYVEKLIEAKKFVSAKKLLSIADSKKYYTNKFYELKDKIKKEYFFDPKQKASYQ